MSETVQPSRRRIFAIVAAGAVAWAAGPLLVLFDAQRHEIVTAAAPAPAASTLTESDPAVAPPASEPATAVAVEPAPPAGGELLPASTDSPPAEPKPDPVSVSG